MGSLSLGPHWTHPPLGYMPPSPTSLQFPHPQHTRIPMTRPCLQINDQWDHHQPSVRDPSPEPVPELTGIPASLSPPPICPCQAPAPCGMTGNLACWDRHQPGVRQLHRPACQETHPLGGASPSSTVFPNNHSTRLLLRLPLKGSKQA
jgi:hypothetical protein